MDNAIVVAIVIWLIVRFVGAANRKKAAERKQAAPGQQPAPTARQQQAAQIQKRLREAYEAAQRQQTAAPAAQQAEDDTPPYRRPPTEDDDTPPYRRAAAVEAEQPRVPHHIDAIEEERCEEAEKVRQERRKQELLERFGPPAQRSTLRKPPRPSTFAQAAQPRDVESPASPQACAAFSLAAAQAAAYRRGPELPREVLTQGIIMAEILGPPRSKRSIMQK